MKQQQIDAIVASFHALPDTAGIPMKVYCRLAHRSMASANRDITSGKIDSVLIGGSRRIIVGSVRKLFGQ